MKGRRTWLVSCALAGATISGSAVACSIQPVSAIDENSGSIPAPPAEVARIESMLPAGFVGEAWVGVGSRIHKAGYDDICDRAVWPWASITKQIVATLVMRQVDAGRIVLDAPVGTYLALPAAGDTPMPTVRQLLQHRAGLRNPEDTPADSAGIPAFYKEDEEGSAWCLAERIAPPAEGFRYNNCDYILLGALLEQVAGQPVARQIADLLAPLGPNTAYLATRKPRGIVGTKQAPIPLDISRYGAAGAMVGPLSEIAYFNRALMDGNLLTDEARAEMWTGDPALGYMALGQWVFEAALSGCASTVRIVERRGQILNYELRNFILPDLGKSLVVGAREPGFEFGEIWSGTGTAHDLLSVLACEEHT